MKTLKFKKNHYLYMNSFEFINLIILKLLFNENQKFETPDFPKFLKYYNRKFKYLLL